ncbi:MAG: dienelactone hydrolase family protein [Planctomycetes bacterium]|nr:dienelactone hydrolase family protein [Planctomycetota bacterium]
MKTLTLLPLIPVLAFAAPLEEPKKPDPIKTEVVEYKHGDVVLEGYLAYDQTMSASPRPAVVVFHEWRGHGDYVRMRARELAKLGYIAFAADMYGKGVFAKDHEEAGKLAGAFFKDRALMRARAQVALDTLKRQVHVDPKRIAAMGYCFGGTTSLEMARGGQEVVAVASFHGNLSAPEPAKSIKAKVIVFNGADDKFTADQVEAFKMEMKDAGADLEFIDYKGAVHSFTVKEAGDDPSKGMAYNADADRDSWAKLDAFLKKAFQQK